MESKSKKILVVEDEPDILNLLGDTFQYYGFEVDLESEADLAWNKFHDNVKGFDAVLLDLNLGKSNGNDLYKKLKKLNLDTKIFVFTGMAFDSNEFRTKICPSFQDQFLIRKPVQMSLLVEKVESVLNGHH